VAKLTIITEPHPVLHQVARRIQPGKLDLAKLYLDMQETMAEAEGVGLAAPQVGLPIRFIIASVGGEVRPFVNPKIVWSSSQSEVDEEGCLSIPGLYGLVERAVEVEVEFEDLEFNRHRQRFAGFDARVIQHEIDHLNGILISDRALGGLYEGRRRESQRTEEEMTI